MVSDRPSSLLILWVLLVPVLAGCLDADASLEAGDGIDVQGGDLRDGQETADAEPRLVLGAHNISLAPWLDRSRAVVAQPDEGTLVQVAGIHQDGVLLRLLFDGSAFMLTGRPTQDAELLDDSVFLARIASAGSAADVASNHTNMSDGRSGFVMRLPAVDRVVMGDTYRLEVYGFRWDDRSGRCIEAPCSGKSDPLASLMHGHSRVSTEPTEGPGPIVVWQTSLPLTSRATVTLHGPAEGTDRPDVVESKYALGPETGTYTVNVTGKRIWRADLLLEFQDSLVHASRPEAFGNGSTSMEVFLTGHRPLDVWAGLPADKGFEQSFTLEVDIDHETGHGDVPQDGQQYFFATLQHGYRMGGSTFVAGSSGDDLSVRVRAE